MRKLFFNYQCLYLLLLFKIINGGLVKEIFGTSQETAKKEDDKTHKVFYLKQNNSYFRIERRGNFVNGYLPGRNQSDKIKINVKENNIKFKETEAGVTFAEYYSTWLRQGMPSVTPTNAVSTDGLFVSMTPESYTVQGTAMKNNSNERGNFTGGYLPGTNQSVKRKINLESNKHGNTEDQLFTFAASTTTRLPHVIPNVKPTKGKQISEETPYVFVTSSTLPTNFVQGTTTKNNSHIRIDGKRNFALEGYLTEKRRSNKTRINIEENIIKYEETEDPVFTFAVSTTTQLPHVILNVKPTKEKQISEETPYVFVTSSTLPTNFVQGTTTKNNSHIRIDGKTNFTLEGYLTKKRRSNKTRINIEENIIKYEETEDPVFTFAVSTATRLPQNMTPNATPTAVKQKRFLFVKSPLLGTNTTTKSILPIEIDVRGIFKGGCIDGTNRTEDGRCEEVV